MTWEELETLLRSRRHTEELSALRSEVNREVANVKGTRQKILAEDTQMKLAHLVADYLEGKPVRGATERHILARRVAAALLGDAQRDTSKKLQAVAAPSQDAILPSRGAGRMDCVSALARLEVFLKQGGELRMFADRDSVAVVYREVGTTGESLQGALVDLAGKLERIGAK